MIQFYIFIRQSKENSIYQVNLTLGVDQFLVRFDKSAFIMKSDMLSYTLSLLCKIVMLEIVLIQRIVYICFLKISNAIKIHLNTI